MRALTSTNEVIPAVDPLHVTVGDEFQAVYRTLGEAVRATYHLRNEIFSQLEVRVGLGGGDVVVIDESRGIQDGSAWWNARAAIEYVNHAEKDTGNVGLRTWVIDTRAPDAYCPVAQILALIDANLYGLRAGARRTLIQMQDGHTNAEIAVAENISESANSQRIRNNALVPLVEALRGLGELR